MDIAIQADDLRHTRDTVLGLIAQDTGQDVETVERDSRRDRWFSAEDALAYGFVDRVVSSIEEIRPSAGRPLGLGVYSTSRSSSSSPPRSSDEQHREDPA
jgi:ATP-dependent Clp protease protease subunit